MGRTAKYLTREERLQARRNREAVRYQQPGVKQARSIQNRRSYEKRRVRANADVIVPEIVRARASWPKVFEDESLFHRFRDDSDLLFLDRIEIGDHELETISNLPPYPTSLTSRLDLDEDWDKVSAALYGYQIRVYTRQQEALLTTYHITTDLDFSSSLLRKYRGLLAALETLNDCTRRFAKTGNQLASHIACHNAHWTASQIVFTYDDLQAIARGDGSYLPMSCDRIYSLGRLSSG